MSLFHRLLGHQCPLCLNKSSDYLCRVCLDNLPRIDHACPTCGLPLDDEATCCPDCIKYPKPYILTASPLLYSHPVDNLIHRFKQQTPIPVTAVLVPLLKSNIDKMYSDQTKPDALIPVPLHWTGLMKRGFNQAHCLADFLSRTTNIPCTPIATKRRTKKSQKSLDRNQRLRNLRGTYGCKIDLTGKHVAIVDDVITSCATVINLTNVLLNAGAVRVDVWALARTPLKK